MSTRRKSGGTSLSMFLARRTDMRPARDTLMLNLRMFRELLVAKEASESAWSELAGMVNVFGLYSGEQNRRDWTDILIGAAYALREIGARHDRVGGRWAATPAETEALTAALNLVDNTIMPDMAMVDFIRLAKFVNAMSEEETA
ncbi:MAG TPA: hypothetical protein VJ652_15205 [Noviherbaspirillum sp.]|nr:hypothetical protein [Noviherbaspirillum sp.]